MRKFHFKLNMFHCYVYIAYFSITLTLLERKQYPTADTCGRLERKTVRFSHQCSTKFTTNGNTFGNEEKMRRKCHFDNGFIKSAVIIYHNKIIVNGVERGRFQKMNRIVCCFNEFHLKMT